MTLLARLRAPRLRRCLSVVAILALALRALIPTGFMIAADAGHARLVVCPAGIHDALHAHHAHQADGTGHAGEASHNADLCPYAMAGGPGLAGLAPGVSEPYFVRLETARPVVPASVPAAPPPRHHAPRGPPFLA
jgi:hypothetical protein